LQRGLDVQILGSPTSAELKQLNPRLDPIEYSSIEPYSLHKVRKTKLQYGVRVISIAGMNNRD
jgi:hypothetical protein